MSRSRASMLVAGVAVAAVAVTGSLLLAGSGSGGGDAGERVAPAPAEREVPVAGSEQLAGYARDVNLNPVAGVAVRVAGGGELTRTDEQGRYELRAPPGETRLVAEHPDYVRQDVTLAERPPGGRLDFSLAATEPAAAGPNSGHRLIFWASCGDVAALSDPELDDWIERGLDGFVCSTGRLEVTGRDDPFDLDALRSSAVVRKARAGELKLYFGFYASNSLNTRTPLMEWFDDQAWSERLLPALGELAAEARSLGFAGVAIDQELYPAPEDTEATWAWDYPDSQRPEAEVRAQVTERGGQVMGALLEGFPGLEVVAYNTEVPGNWSERVQEVVNDNLDAFEDDVRIDFWDGMTSVPGYSAIHWLDATFYKTPHISNDWDTGLQYNANRVYSLLSRRFSNWPYASSRLHLSPFAWIDAGLSEFQAAREPGYVAEQLEAFSRWGMGGMLASYDYSEFGDFDYEPYGDALRESSSPATVDDRPPRLSIGRPVVGDELQLAGTATGDLAIRAVRWYDGRGRSGTAELEWEILDGDVREGWEWRMNWRLAGVPAPSGETRLTIVAEDIKGLASVRNVTVTP